MVDDLGAMLGSATAACFIELGLAKGPQIARTPRKQNIGVIDHSNPQLDKHEQA